ncbi:hypothetical protein ABNP39_20240 (plasmid) [Pantoea dispersa]|jgi:hypothetical protein|uniref:hypothetical protein n=1 Tax=Pantoea TaxID=53335 RepID=UPI00073EC3A6|nr:hypothetical protein [Pantoea sp. Ap-870]NIE51855.1 hypothetical protein [Pantoea sp. Ap-870]
MYRSEDEKLADIVMGDAVLQLLKQAGPVTTLALLEKLRAMAASETDPVRQRAFRYAIAEVQNSKSAPQGEAVALKGSDNVTHIFRNRDNTGKNTRH